MSKLNGLEIVRLGQKRRHGAALCAIVGAMAVAWTCIAVRSSLRASAQLERRAVIVNRDWTDAARQVQTGIELRQSQDAIARHAESVELLAAPASPSVILAEVSNALPSGCWLSSIEIDGPEADGAQGAANGNQMRVRLSGLAPSNSQAETFLSSLSRSKLVVNAKLARFNDAPRPSAKLSRFGIELSVIGAAGNGSSEPRVMTASIGH